MPLTSVVSELLKNWFQMYKNIFKCFKANCWNIVLVIGEEWLAEEILIVCHLPPVGLCEREWMREGGKKSPSLSSY